MLQCSPTLCDRHGCAHLHVAHISAPSSAAQRSAAQEIGRAASLPHSTEALEAKVDDELRRWYGLPLLL
jgi:hypothetical protein